MLTARSTAITNNKHDTQQNEARSHLFCEYGGQQFKDDHTSVRVAVLQTRLEQTHNVSAALRRVLCCDMMKEDTCKKQIEIQ